MSHMRVRFPPSPTGHWHLGNARTALFNWLAARHYGGTFILRVEDTDRQRYVPEALDEIIEGMRWLGMDYDEGPIKGGPHEPYFQSQRLEIYREFARRLCESGHAYPCFCTPERLAEMRKQQRAAGLAPKYDRRCRSLDPEEAQRRIAAGEPHVLRFATPDGEKVAVRDMIRGTVEFNTDDLDDFVLVKSDGFPVYNFAVVVDDITMEITHVIRGEDHLSNTPRQLLIYRALGAEPPRFAHVPLLLNKQRKKLSKRELSKGVLAYRDEGYLPSAVVNFLALLGWSPGDDRELMSVEEICAEFTIERISPAPAIFDVEKMEWLNSQHITATAGETLLSLARPFLAQRGLLPEGELDAQQRDYAIRVMDLMKSRSRTLVQLAEYTDFLFSDEYSYDPKGVRKRLLCSERIPAILDSLAAVLDAVEPWAEEEIESAFRAEMARLEVGGEAIHAARVAVSGRTVGPGLFELLEVLGKERTCARLRRTAELLRSGELQRLAESPAGEGVGEEPKEKR